MSAAQRLALAALALALSSAGCSAPLLWYGHDPQRTRRDIPGRPEICTVFAWHKAFGAPQEEVDEVYRGCTTAELGCVQDKRDLAERVKARIGPIRARREELMADPTAIDEILADGAARARAIAAPVLGEVKEAMGLR